MSETMMELLSQFFQGQADATEVRIKNHITLVGRLDALTAAFVAFARAPGHEAAMVHTVAALHDAHLSASAESQDDLFAAARRVAIEELRALLLLPPGSVDRLGHDGSEPGIS